MTVTSISAMSPFATEKYFEAWLAAFGGGAGGVFRPAGGEAALAYMRTVLSIGPLRLSAAKSASNDHTARFDVVGDLRSPAKIFDAIFRTLRVSVLRFDYLASDSRLLGAVRTRGNGVWYHDEFCEYSPFVDCTIPWETYWEDLGTTRELWARRERKLINREGAVFRCLARWEAIEPHLPRIYEVEASGWKGKEGSAILQSAQTLDFYNRCLRHWAEEGWLRVFMLEFRGEIIAFQIAVLHAGVVYQIKVGYDDRHAKLSPGQVLQLQLLRWAFEDVTVRAYDMLGGGGKAAGNKRKWSTDLQPLYTLWVFRRNLGGLLAWMRFVLAPRLKRAVRGEASSGAPAAAHDDARSGQ